MTTVRYSALLCGSGYKVWDYDLDDYVTPTHTRDVAHRIATFLNYRAMSDQLGGIK